MKRVNSKKVGSWLALASVLFVTACGKVAPEAKTAPSKPVAPVSPAAVLPINGTWVSGPVNVLGLLKLTQRIKITANSFNKTVTCTYPDGKSLSAEAVSRAEITTTAIKTLEKNERTAAAAAAKCTASIVAETINYTIKNNALTLTKPGETVTFTRVP